MKIGIVIPYYKREFFNKALESLASQTSRDFRVYIGDDASPEDPETILREYRDKLDLVYHRFNNNLGAVSLTKQWERCIAMTGGEEWIMVLGDDDILSSGVIASFYDHLATFSGKANVVRFATKIINEMGEPVSEIFQHPKWESPEEAFLRRYYGQTRSSLSEYVFLKEKFNKYKFADYKLAWHSDDRAWLEFSEEKLIYSINDALVFFRHSPLNVTGREDNLVQKKIASTDFYKYLATNPGFTKKHKLLFGRIYERNLRENGKLNYSQWIDLLKIYSGSLDYKAFKNLLKRFIDEKLNRAISNF